MARTITLTSQSPQAGLTNQTSHQWSNVSLYLRLAHRPVKKSKVLDRSVSATSVFSGHVTSQVTHRSAVGEVSSISYTTVPGTPEEDGWGAIWSHDSAAGLSDGDDTEERKAAIASNHKSVNRASKVRDCRLSSNHLIHVSRYNHRSRSSLSWYQTLVSHHAVPAPLAANPRRRTSPRVLYRQIIAIVSLIAMFRSFVTLLAPCSLGSSLMQMTSAIHFTRCSSLSLNLSVNCSPLFPNWFVLVCGFGMH